MAKPNNNPANDADEERDHDPSISPGHAAYNIVTDTVTGVNVRWRDNLLQALLVFIAVVLAAVVGAVLAVFNPQWDLPWFGGAIIGSFVGLVLGIIGSGVFLMLYRLVRHIQGKHD